MPTTNSSPKRPANPTNRSISARESVDDGFSGNGSFASEHNSHDSVILRAEDSAHMAGDDSRDQPEVIKSEAESKDLHGQKANSVSDVDNSPKGRSENASMALDQLRIAKQAIENAPFSTSEDDLYAPLYHNLSTFKKSYELMEQMFKIFIYEDGNRPLVHDGPMLGIYASEGRFIHQLQSNRQFVVKDPNKAQIFFLPYSVANLVIKMYVPDSHNMLPLTNFITDYVNSIASKYPFWNRSAGADHFFVSCHDWGPATARGHPQLRQNSIKVVCNADLTEEFIPKKDVSLPEIYLHSKSPTKLGGPGPGKRRYLAFFAGHMHGRVRPILLLHWKNKDPAMKIYEMLPETNNRRSKNTYFRHMKMSKFCICPMGYEVNSPRIVESIYNDCVPVIIADNFVLPFAEVLNWEAFSVKIKEKEVPELKKILTDISPARYRIMQGRLRHVRKHFMWHKMPSSFSRYDAFHMILHSIWLKRLASL